MQHWMSPHRAITRYLVILFVCVIAFASSTPSAAQTMLRPLAWRETPLLFDRNVFNLCFVPNKPNIVLAYERVNGFVAYDWHTGARIPATKYQVLSSSGDTNFSDDSCESIGEVNTPNTGHRSDHQYTHFSVNDHRNLYAFEYDQPSKFTNYRLWVSTDMGQTWEERIPPPGTYLQGLAVSPEDSATLFIGTKTLTDTGERSSFDDEPIYKATYEVFRSSDTGRSWKRRSQVYSVQEDTLHPPTISLAMLSGGKGEYVVLTYDAGLPGSSNIWIYLLSIDGGRTFREVGGSGIGGSTFLRRSGTTVLRLQTSHNGAERLTRSSDGGATWKSLAGPVTYYHRYQVNYHGLHGGMRTTRADPSSVFVFLLGLGRWYSSDAGSTWRQIADPSSYDIFISPFAPLTVFRIKNHRLSVLDFNGTGADPLAPVTPPEAHDSNTLYFPETKHQVGLLFRSAWEQYGGVAQLGYPLSEEFIEVNIADSRPYLVQYFEQGRLEYHPELDPKTSNHQTLLGLLGSEITARRRLAQEAPFLPVANPQQPDVVYFPITQHTLRGQFKLYWQNTGGLMMHGYPISEEFTEVSRDDGRSYLVQYFERSRMEVHLGAKGRRILLGRLGTDLLRSRSLLLVNSNSK